MEGCSNGEEAVRGNYNKNFYKGRCYRIWKLQGHIIIDITYQVLASTIKMRLEHIVEPQLVDYQAGFMMEKKNTTDQKCMMNEVVTTCYGFKIPAVSLFFDF